MKKEKLKAALIPTILIVLIFLILVLLSFNTKGTKASDPSYPPDNVVENLAAVMVKEIGCGGATDQQMAKDQFVYQLTWVNTVVNQYNFWFEKRKTPSTVAFNVNNLCDILSRGGKGGSYNPDYCYNKINAPSVLATCKPYEVEQLKLAVKLVLNKSFNIPKNIYYAAHRYIVEKKDSNGNLTNELFQCYQPLVGGKPLYTNYRNNVCFGTQDGEKMYTTDLYGNTVSTDFTFYKKLALCLYDNPIYEAYNNCTASGGSASSSQPAPKLTYVVYLYPNGGTGISEGQKFEYTEITPFSKFPSVSKTNCTLDGWNIDSPNGKEYYNNVGPEDNEKKLYARWSCNSQPSTQSQTEEKKYTVSFVLNDGTDTVYTTKTVKENETINAPTNIPQIDGYVFDGWKTKDGNVFNFNTKIENNITLYASWKTTIKEKQIEEEPKQTSSSNENSKQESKSDNKESYKNEKIINPNTGIFNITIFLLLIIPSSFGVIYYHKYIKKSDSDTNNM